MPSTPTYPGDTSTGAGAPVQPIPSDTPTGAGAPVQPIPGDDSPHIPTQSSTPPSAGAPAGFPQSAFRFRAPRVAVLPRPEKHGLGSKSSPAAGLSPTPRVGWFGLQKRSSDGQPAKFQRTEAPKRRRPKGLPAQYPPLIANLPQPQFSSALENPFLTHLGALPRPGTNDISEFLGHDAWVRADVSSLIPPLNDCDVHMASEEAWKGLDQSAGLDYDVPMEEAWKGLDQSADRHREMDVDSGSDARGGLLDHLPPNYAATEPMTAPTASRVDDNMVVDLDSWTGISGGLPPHNPYPSPLGAPTPDSEQEWGGLTQHANSRATNFSRTFVDIPNGSTGRDDSEQGWGGLTQPVVDSSPSRHPTAQEPSGGLHPPRHARRRTTVADANDSDDEDGAGPSNIHERRHVHETGSVASIGDIRFRSPPREPSNGNLEGIYHRFMRMPNTPARYEDLGQVIKLTAHTRQLPTPSPSPQRNGQRRSDPGTRDPGNDADVEDPCFDPRRKDPFTTKLYEDMRDYCDITLLNLATRPIAVPSPEDKQAFTNDRHSPHGPKLADLRLDLDTTQWRSSVWNKAASHLVANEFIKEDEYECKNVKLVRKAFMSHLAQLRNRFVTQLRAQLPPDDAVELELVQAAKHLRRENRRRALRDRRSKAIERMMQGLPNGARLEQLSRFKYIMQHMSHEVMSGDESDNDMGVFAIKVLPWRSKDTKVLNWFRTLDHLYLSTRFTSADKPKSGPFPHKRVVTSRIDHESSPPKGLPKNFYDPNYLSSLDAQEREQLEIRDAVDLSFPPNLEYCSIFGGSQFPQKAIAARPPFTSS
ncbi:hypothetical protein EYR40_000378 [Pleurotus pulmonarius]|nr:hypothetical protein EYR36_001265 [Pleurotus pulmonarius]KAF4608036.1 hypothetical protein EYR40_000378 [Pleurotus pulmonarius]